MKTNIKLIKKIVICVLSTILIACLSACSNFEQKAIYSVVEITIYNKENIIVNTGTGFCINKESEILSVYHLFEGYETDYTIKFKTINGKEGSLELIKYDINKDLALLKTNGESLTPLNFSSQSPNNLDEIYFIGNTNGYGLNYNKGIVSMSEKTFILNGECKNVMQTNISINPGDSGGPLFNQNGEIVGMMSFRLVNGNGLVIEGHSFSILLNDLKQFVCNNDN